MKDSEKEIISTLKYVSHMKPEFMLSEIKNYITYDMSVEQIYSTVRPFLYELGIDVSPEGTDFRIRLSPPATVMELTEEEVKKSEFFFRSAVVSAKLQTIIEQYISKKTAKKWDDPLVLDRIRKAVVSQKNAYWNEGGSRNISYEKGYNVLGYLAYQFPVYFVQFQHILYSMAQTGILKTRMKVLDVGTGPGTVPLAIADFYRRLEGHKADIYCIELYDENIEAFNSIVPQYAPDSINLHEPIRSDVSKIKPESLPEDIDLMVFSNVLNEIKDITTEQKAAIVTTLAQRLASDGSILVIEPADRVNSVEMRKLSIELKNAGLGIYAPCSFMWGGGCSLEGCWSFEQKQDITPTLLMRKLSECDEPYRYINTDIKYSYFIVRKDGLTKECYKVPHKAKFARFSKMGTHKDKRINVVCSLMSADLGDEKYSLYKVCDGTSKKAVYAILPWHNVTEDNSLIKRAKYGEVLEIYNVLVNYNKDKDAYNLLLSKGSTVSRIGDEKDD
ncbi:small ribosomal subunit Rsm22 family protein [uncultured Methanomethylovorans sp.]|uniref:small ribosomal subunit Rsm22 family protein n=1 Tax=uncultured Methanomethylovorans sp. TaxID=183759 RepID=UPI002AA71FDE|nr:small ribosomal subunit Rsm22 family protein [uncultured Methanomethylovorans sp.]